MGDSKKEIRIKAFQTHIFDDLVDKVNVWLSYKQDKKSNSFEFINLKYYYKESPPSDSGFQHSAIVIYKDSQENLSKEKTTDKNDTTNDEEFIAEKKKLEYRK